MMGVPLGGAFDTESLRLANALVGREDGEVAWELSMATATFVAAHDGWVAFTGALAECRVGAWIGESNSVRPVRKGDEVWVGSPNLGCRTYVQIGKVGRTGRFAAPDFGRAVGVMRGPDADLKIWPEVGSLTVSRIMNRVGVRGEPRTEFEHAIELASKPQTVGSIQATPAGELIIIGPDGPVTGGYPQPWVVGQAWMGAVAQLTPGQTAESFVVTADEARQEWQRRESSLAARLRDFRLGLAT